jgi:hypothetical protein
MILGRRFLYNSTHCGNGPLRPPHWKRTDYNSVFFCGNGNYSTILIEAQKYKEKRMRYLNAIAAETMLLQADARRIPLGYCESNDSVADA